MTLWLVRAGSHGEYEKRFLEESRIYLTWNDIDTNLGTLKDKETLRIYLGKFLLSLIASKKRLDRIAK